MVYWQWNKCSVHFLKFWSCFCLLWVGSLYVIMLLMLNGSRIGDIHGDSKSVYKLVSYSLHWSQSNKISMNKNQE